jgi:membrane fusion protein (multidrug efflux system)
VKKNILGKWVILIVLVLTAVHFGCSGADGAQEAADSSDSKQEQAATPASEDNGEAGDENGEGDDEEGEEEEKKEEAVPVEIAELERGAIESVLRFSSNLEAESQVKVVSQAKRLVTRLLVEEGDRVKQGDLLLQLQDAEQRSQLAKVESQLAKAEREYVQQERLYSQELISEQAFNDATYELDQLKISLEDARRELSYTEVRAPISGTVTARMINLGDQVQIGQELFEIIDFDSIVARIFVPERHLPELRAGLEARVSAQAAGAEDYRCTVKRIAPVVDPKSGTVKVTVNVGRQAGLRPGMYVDVDLVTATHADAVLVPKRALVYDNDQVFVFRLNDEHRVDRVFIEPKLSDKYFIEPRDGLTAGDQVVVAGQTGLKDGALVQLPGEEEEGDDADAAAADVAMAQRASL